MAQKKFTELPAAAALDGSEVVAVVQGGSSTKTTTQDIADLGSGGGDVSSVFSRTGAVTAQSGDYTAAQVTGAEATANKATDFSTINDTLYPTVEAVEDRINSLISARITYSDLNLTGM